MQLHPFTRGRSRRGADNANGFSILQLLITLTVASIVSAFAIINFRSTQASLRLSSSVRQLAGYMEKARLNAIKRHSTSSVVFSDNTTYNVTMDFGGDGNVTTKSFTFESGVGIISTPLPTINFNWRGRTTSCTITFAVQNIRGEQSWVDVSDAGDVTVNSNVDTLPTVDYSTVSSSSDVSSSSVVTGSALHNNAVDCVTAGLGVAGPPISGSGVGCTDVANPSSISIRKLGGSSATITVTATNTGTISVQAPINLRVTPQTQTIVGGGSDSFTITSLNSTRGTFAVNFNSPCTTLTVLLTVTN